VGNQQLSIHITRLLDDLKSSKNYCPRKLFSGSNFSPEKSLQKNRSIFCLENQSCDRRQEPTGFGDHAHGTHWVWRLGSQEPTEFGDCDHGTNWVWQFGSPEFCDFSDHDPGTKWAWRLGSEEPIGFGN